MFSVFAQVIVAFNVSFLLLTCSTFSALFAGTAGKLPSVSNLSQLSDSHYKSNVPYTPDFSVKIITETQYVKIHRAHYIAATRATAMARRNGGGSPGGALSVPVEDAFQKEWSRAISISTAEDEGRSLESPMLGARPNSPSGSDHSRRSSGGFESSERLPLSPIHRSDEDGADSKKSSSNIDSSEHKV